MNCKRCGNLLKEGEMKCPVCGEEAEKSSGFGTGARKAFFSAAGDLQGKGEEIKEIPKRGGMVEMMPASIEDTGEKTKFGRMKRVSEEKSEYLEERAEFRRMKRASEEESKSLEERTEFGRMKRMPEEKSEYLKESTKFERMKRASEEESKSLEERTEVGRMKRVSEEESESLEERAEFRRMKRMSEEESKSLEERTEFERMKRVSVDGSRRLEAESTYKEPTWKRETDSTERRPGNDLTMQTEIISAARQKDAEKTEVKKVSCKIYFIDFILRLGKKENIPLAIYLVLNILLISGIVTFVFNMPVWAGLLGGLCIYTGSIVIAVSPIGEAILRKQINCVKIRERSVVDRLLPIYEEVYARAKELEPELSDDIRLYICDEKEQNAFATGRRTICLTQGIMDLSDDEIKAVLGHEFGHLAHKDTDRILVVAVGNCLITGFCMIVQGVIIAFQGLMLLFSLFNLDDEDSHAIGVAILTWICRVIAMLFIHSIMRIWSGIGILLCMKTSRENEYLADQFSYRMGYGEPLCAALDRLDDGHLEGLFANLAKSHPDAEDRIGRLAELAEREEKDEKKGCL